MTAIARPFRPSTLIEPRSIAAGVLAAAALLGIYLGIISLAQGVEHALEQLATDASFVSLIATGFGTQIALFVELRTVDQRHRSAAAVTAAGTGTSAAAMLACCAHHLGDLLPLVGLSAAAVFLDAYQTPLFLVSIGMNVVGIVVIARQLQRARRASAVVDAASEVPAGTHRRPSRSRQDPGMEITRGLRIPVYGLGCGGAGAAGIERALAATDGVLRAYVNPATETAYIDFVPAETDASELARVIDRAGYEAGRPTEL